MRPAVRRNRGIPPRRLWLLTFLLVAQISRTGCWHSGFTGPLAPWPVLTRWSPSRCNQSKRAAYQVGADATAILFPETRACWLHKAGDTWSLVFTFLAQSLDSVPPLCYAAGGLRSAKPLDVSEPSRCGPFGPHTACSNQTARLVCEVQKMWAVVLDSGLVCYSQVSLPRPHEVFAVVSAARVLS